MTNLTSEFAFSNPKIFPDMQLSSIIGFSVIYIWNLGFPQSDKDCPLNLIYVTMENLSFLIGSYLHDSKTMNPTDYYLYLALDYLYVSNKQFVMIPGIAIIFLVHKRLVS